jgi:hypothetical protein
MTIRKTELLKNSELTSLLNRQNYSSIELFDKVTPDLIDLLRKVRRSDNVKVVVLSK